MHQLPKIFGVLIAAFFLTNILDIFIIGLQFPVFSLKYWILLAVMFFIVWVAKGVWDEHGKANSKD